ncbi:unnamed protein product [Sphagnum balticum]
MQQPSGFLEDADVRPGTTRYLSILHILRDNALLEHSSHSQGHRFLLTEDDQEMLKWCWYLPISSSSNSSSEMLMSSSEIVVAAADSPLITQDQESLKMVLSFAI